MKLTIVSQIQKYVPTIAEGDIESHALKGTILKGNTTGCRSVVTVTTAEGITIQGESIGKVYTPGEKDYNEWTIEGNPNLKMNMYEPDIMSLTAAAMVNRIPDTLAVPSGSVPTSQMDDGAWFLRLTS